MQSLIRALQPAKLLQGGLLRSLSTAGPVSADGCEEWAPPPAAAWRPPPPGHERPSHRTAGLPPLPQEFLGRPLPESVTIVEVGPRDGLQNEATKVRGRRRAGWRLGTAHRISALAGTCRNPVSPPSRSLSS